MTEEVTEKQQTTQVSPEPSKSNSGLWIGIIMLLMIVLIAGASFYMYQQLHSQSDDISKEDQRVLETEKQITGFQAQLATVQAQLTAATSTISNADDRFEEKITEHSKSQDEKLEATRKELTTAVLQIQRQLGKTRGDWLIADAEYLLSVAGQRLHLMGDVETTREALEAADQRLRESGDVATFKVREEIAKELATLRAVPAIDLVGMYAKLESLSSRVNQLTLFLPYQGKPVLKSSEHDKHPAPSLTSSDLINAALKQFDGYVTVRHTEQPIKAILTAEEAQFIRQQLSLKLEMIKLALVQKNQSLYQASLNDALGWIDKNFNKNTETQQFSAELIQLSSFKLNAQMPDISLSLKMLRDISKLRIETDKAMPTVDLEHKELPKTEETKPVAAEPETVTSEPKAVSAPTTTTTQAPAPAPAPVAATPEVKKVAESLVAPPASKPVAPAPAAVEVKKAPQAPASVAQPAKPISAPNSAVVTTAPTATTEPKKAAPAPITVDKPADKTEPVNKSPQPTVLKPVVVH